MIRQRIAVFVAALALMLAIPALAWADYSDGVLYYSVGEGTITITGSYGSDTEVSVPSQIYGTPVNKIASGAFANNAFITKINLPATVTEVEEGAFNERQVVVYNSDTDEPVAIGGVSTAEVRVENVSTSTSQSGDSSITVITTENAGSTTVASQAGSNASSNTQSVASSSANQKSESTLATERGVQSSAASGGVSIGIIIAAVVVAVGVVIAIIILMRRRKA